MCGYYGMCDSDGNCIGHTGKVTKEYYDILKSEYDVSIKASPCIIKYLDDIKADSSYLKYDINIDLPFTLKKRIIDKFKILYNINSCITKSKEEILFFYQVDFFFFFYIWLFHRKKNSKIYCLIYHQNFTGGMFEKALYQIYILALKKIDGVIYTQKGMHLPHKNTFWMPDYLYTPEQYAKYSTKEKCPRVVCLGTMNRYKQLEELVDVFRNIPYQLEICGRFDDAERYQNLLAIKSDNIIISNTVLSDDEYYTKLGNSKFSILPYCMEQYTNRTSGVLLESLYIGSIPIAPKQLLAQNQLPGYGYHNIYDLADCAWLNVDITSIDELLNMTLHKKKEFISFFNV